MQGYIRRKATRHLGKGLTLPNGKRGSPESDATSVIPARPLDSEAYYLINNGVWILISEKESERYTWSGVIQVNGQNWNMYIP